METVEVAIVGAGVMGAATAWALSKRGVETMIVEQFHPGHDRGSSHGPTRVFRFAYDDPFYVRMAQRSLSAWHELEVAGGRKLLSVTGGIDLGASIDATLEALRSCDASAERLEPAAIAERFGIETSGPGVFSPDTGVLAAPAAVASMLDASGVPVRDGVRAGVEVAGETVVVAGVRARRCVLAAGAWMGPLLARAGIEAPLQVTQEQVLFFAGGDDLPVVIERGARFRYLVPPAHGAPGAKAGEHGAGERTSADGRSSAIDPEGQARVCDWVAGLFPGVGRTPVAADTCLYTTTPDEHFVIDTRGPLVIASPCSGHGFKFAPLIGEVLAALALGEEPPVDCARFALGRF